MKSQGIELFNEYNTPWLGLPTIDDRRNFEVEQQENPDDSENDYDDDVKTRRDPKEGP
tara:strand:+ start:300 stop:473 length:174 start_codon:yes stop_codon:yes gene_type:complete